MATIADTARSNIISALVTDTVIAETDADNLSNVDLMVLLRSDGLQTVWTFTDATDAINYWQYLESLRT